jgi:hypothetical protein
MYGHVGMLIKYHTNKKRWNYTVKPHLNRLNRQKKLYKSFVHATIMDESKLGNIDVRIFKWLGVVWELTTIDKPRGALSEADKNVSASESMNSSRPRASSASYSIVATMFFDLPAAVEPLTVRGGREEERRGRVRKESGMRESADTIYGTPYRCVPAYLLFSPHVQAFSHVALVSACPSRTHESTIPGSKVLSHFKNRVIHACGTPWRTNRPKLGPTHA